MGSHLNRATPGVYITEEDAFGSSIVGVATAVPIFIGYTEFAGEPQSGRSLYNEPVRISSMTEFATYFGGAALQSYTVTRTPPAAAKPAGSAAPSGSGTPGVAPQQTFVADYTTVAPNSGSRAGGAGAKVAASEFTLASTEPNQFNLYWQMLLFFANGGGDCYVVSVGSYWENQFPASRPHPIPDHWSAGSIAVGDPSTPGDAGLLVGLTGAGHTVGPTMIVIPEACQLNQSDYSTVVVEMLTQASALKDRLAILDLPGCMSAGTLNDLLTCQTNLSKAIAPQASGFSYAVAYAPALSTSVVAIEDILFTSLLATGSGDNSIINNILTTQAAQLYGDRQLATIQGAIASAFPLEGRFGAENSAQYSVDASGYAGPSADTSAALLQWQTSLDYSLLDALPIYSKIKQLIAKSMNVAPPSGMLAGIWAESDMQSGVWNAPANLALMSVDAPLYNMSDDQQSGFNVPANGQAINVLRAQPGRGTVVWGARTLDGNSNDYRYVHVRRTLIYVEQSLKAVLRSYAFAANDALTWENVKASISSFLTGLWRQGGLVGASDAFAVSCGLGTTMTSQDILDGYMIVAVRFQMIRPAEFMELTFVQAMES